MALTLNGQNLKGHLWKNRVVLIITNDSESENYASQLEEFKMHNQEFEERKLIVYKILPNKYKLQSNTDNSWVKSSDLYIKYKPTNSAFRLILIGLDGGIKIEQNELLTAKELFLTIDAMPMRRAEIKNEP
tara:strand:+ start:178 stop:570 length:393 start_codon:yes stop_codon:yes gene_type:complete